MADFSTGQTGVPTGYDRWQDDNDRGLMLAADGDWSEAIEAFAAAADSLARSLPSGSHEPLALVLGNLAQACFRAGRIDDAVQHQQRSTALRVTLTGEDGMPVARARMDLAVMLASAGRCDDAWVLMQRVIASVEHRVGGEDARLAIVLENAARIALASNNAANAEPLLLRLHALLDAHELSTSRADRLLAQVASVRAQQAAVSSEHEPEAMTVPMEADVFAMAEDEAKAEATASSPPLSFSDTDSALQVYAHASIAEQEEWEDQPLRDAVAVTDVLLRTTPSGVAIIPPTPVVEPPLLETDAAPPTTDGLDFALDLAFPEEPIVDDRPEDVVPPNHMSTAEAAGLTGPTHVSPTRTPPSGSLGGLALDFAVEHGVLDNDEPKLQGPPVSTPVPDVLDAAVNPLPAMPALQPPRVAPVTEIITSGPTTGIRPLEGIEGATPPMAMPAIQPAPSAPVADTTPPARPARHTAEQRRAPAKKGGGSALLYIIGGAVVIGGGAAAFFLLR